MNSSPSPSTPVDRRPSKDQPTLGARHRMHPAHHRPLRGREPRRSPELTFSAAAWLKLQLLCHLGPTEIGAFGLAKAEDPLYIEEVKTVPQRCTAVTVRFDDAAVADFYDEQVDRGRHPEGFARVWIHTHPGSSAEPSGTDEETFERVFGRCSWAVMFILARGGETTCRLRVTAPRTGPDPAAPGGLCVERHLPVRVDYSSLAQRSTELPLTVWREEYAGNVTVESPGAGLWPDGLDPWEVPSLAEEAGGALALLDWFDGLEPAEQEALLREGLGEPGEDRGRRHAPSPKRGLGIEEEVRHDAD